jgi:hypothetical protein
MTRFGAYLFGFSLQDKAAALRYVHLLNPAAVIVSDDFSLALTLRTSLPDSIIVYRHYHERDHEYHMFMSPEDFIASHAKFAQPGIVIQALNEPDGYANTEALRVWCIRVMQLATERGMRLLLPNFGVGHPADDVNEWAALLQAYAQYGGHYFGFHEYGRVTPSKEPNLVRRLLKMVLLARTLGVRLRIIVGEIGRDIGGGLNDGWRSVMNESQYSTFLADQIAQYADLPEVLAAVPFALGQGGEVRLPNGQIARKWQSFNLEGAITVQQYTVTHNAAESIIKDWGTPEKRVVGIPELNVRKGPTVKADKIAKLKAGDVVDLYPPEFMSQDDQHIWGRVRTPDGVYGFIAKTVAELRYPTAPDEPEPEPEPTPQPEPEHPPVHGVLLTKEHLQVLKMAHETIAQVYDNALKGVQS